MTPDKFPPFPHPESCCKSQPQGVIQGSCTWWQSKPTSMGIHAKPSSKVFPCGLKPTRSYMLACLFWRGVLDLFIYIYIYIYIYLFICIIYIRKPVKKWATMKTSINHQPQTGFCTDLTTKNKYHAAHIHPYLESKS